MPFSVIPGSVRTATPLPKIPIPKTVQKMRMMRLRHLRMILLDSLLRARISSFR